MSRTRLVAVILALSITSIGGANAGDLTPTAPPGPTMKTLEETLGSWSRLISPTDRFEPVGFGLLDRETGMVWAGERNPTLSWREAVLSCLRYVPPKDPRVTNDYRRPGGFRLPTAAELTTLFDNISPNGVGDGGPVPKGERVDGFWTLDMFPTDTTPTALTVTIEVTQGPTGPVSKILVLPVVPTSGTFRRSLCVRSPYSAHQ